MPERTVRIQDFRGRDWRVTIPEAFRRDIMMALGYRDSDEVPAGYTIGLCVQWSNPRRQLESVPVLIRLDDNTVVDPRKIVAGLPTVKPPKQPTSIVQRVKS